MKLLLHVGMPKAGSTTLQTTFAKSRQLLERHGYVYPDLGRVDHSGLKMCFDPDPIPRIFNGMSFDRIDYLSRLQKICENTSAHTTILSSEFIFSMRLRELQELRRLIDDISNELQLIVYLRDPVSFYLSSAQQQVRASANIVAPAKFSMAIRSRVAMLEDVFGGTLTLCPFDRTLLYRGCVVQDFIHRFLPEFPIAVEIVDSNVSLPAEAMCAMQRLRRFAWPESDNRFDQETRIILRALEQVCKENGIDTKPRLRPAVAAMLSERTQSDREWLASTVGLPLNTFDSYPVAHGDDGDPSSTDLLQLVDVSREAVDRVQALLTRRLALTVWQDEELRRQRSRAASVVASA